MLFNHIWHDWLRWIYFFGEWVKTTDQIESWGAHFVGWCPIIVGMNNWEKLVWITFSEKPTWGMPKQSPRLIKIIYIISMFFITKKNRFFPASISLQSPGIFCQPPTLTASKQLPAEAWRVDRVHRPRRGDLVVLIYMARWGNCAKKWRFINGKFIPIWGIS